MLRHAITLMLNNISTQQKWTFIILSTAIYLANTFCIYAGEWFLSHTILKTDEINILQTATFMFKLIKAEVPSPHWTTKNNIQIYFICNHKITTYTHCSLGNILRMLHYSQINSIKTTKLNHKLFNASFYHNTSLPSKNHIF